MQYLFVLGRQPEISLAEICSVLKKNEINFKIESFQNGLLFLSAAEPLSTDFLMGQLGGTVKIGVARGSFPDELLQEEIKKIILNKINVLVAKPKINFGLSCYSSDSRNEKEKTKKTIFQLGLAIKKDLNNSGFKSRFVSSREPVLSSVIVQTNKLLTPAGAEIILAPYQSQWRLTETLAVQPFAEFSARDYGRPGRDALSGMLPPKLARIMINLAEIEPSAALLDPFCGSGTILTEAALMGYSNIFGNDSNPQAVRDTKENLLWLKQKYPISNLKQCDARTLSHCFQSHSIDAIITEPFLGPPLKGYETLSQIQKITSELMPLYQKTLSEIKKILKPNGKIVMIWPVFVREEQKNLFLPIEKEIKNFVFQIVPLLPAEFSKELTERGTLIYGRPDQKVKREIVRLRLID